MDIFDFVVIQVLFPHNLNHFFIPRTFRHLIFSKPDLNGIAIFYKRAADAYTQSYRVHMIVIMDYQLGQVTYYSGNLDGDTKYPK